MTIAEMIAALQACAADFGPEAIVYLVSSDGVAIPAHTVLRIDDIVSPSPVKEGVAILPRDTTSQPGGYWNPADDSAGDEFSGAP